MYSKILFLIYIIFIVSCSINNSSHNNNFSQAKPFIYFTTDSIKKSWGNCSDEDGQCINIYLKYPKIIDTDIDLKNALDAGIKLFFGEYLVMNEDVNYSELTMEEMVDSAINNYKNITLISNHTSYKEPAWDYELTASIDTFAKAYITVTLTAYTFTGGAHANHTLKHFSLHYKKMVQLTIDNVFTNTDTLRMIAEEEFRRMNDMSSYTTYAAAGFDFPDDKFTLTDNFALKPNGVVFYYNTYEIAPFAKGPVELFIPYNKLYNILQEDFKIIFYNES